MHKVLDSSCNEWNAYIEIFSKEKRDIYFTREYMNLYEKNGDGIAKLFIYEEKDEVAIYPFLMNKIEGYNLDKDYYDIQTAYGYGGPISSTDEDGFLNNFENEFLNFCNKNNIVAEFIRFHPCIKNQKVFNKNITILENRTTVVVDVSKPQDEIWMDDIKGKNRNMIRKSEKNGLTVEIYNDYSTFKNIYEETMGKVDAEGYYYFKDEYYNTMQEDRNYIMLNVKYDNETIASAIFMSYEEYFHYHLAGSKKEYLKFAPNNLLLWEAIKYANSNGKKIFHLGGGLTNSLEDNLFKFKSSFSKEYLKFYIGKRVHNQEIYSHLINEWEKKNNKKASILLQYRL